MLLIISVKHSAHMDGAEDISSGLEIVRVLRDEWHDAAHGRIVLGTP